MKKSEFYLNMFNAYYQQSRDEEDVNKALENNLSRILAILLKESEFEGFQKKFLSLTYKNSQVKIKEVNIQTSTSNLISYYKYKGITRIIPFTLTASKNAVCEEYKKNIDTIPDIVLKVENDLLIFEVKKTSVRAIEQVMEQAKQLANGLNVSYEDVKELTWYDITRILREFDNKVVIRHYLEYIEQSYPEWFDSYIKEYRNHPKLDYSDENKMDPINIIFKSSFRRLYSEEYISSTDVAGVNVVLRNDMNKKSANTLVVLRYDGVVNEIGVHLFMAHTKNLVDYYSEVRKKDRKLFDIEGFAKKKDNHIIPYICIKNTKQGQSAPIKQVFLPEIVDNKSEEIEKYNRIIDYIAEDYEKKKLPLSYEDIRKHFLYDERIDKDVLFEINKLIDSTEEIKNVDTNNIVIMVGFDIYRSYMIPTKNEQIDEIVKDGMKEFNKYFGVQI